MSFLGGISYALDRDMLEHTIQPVRLALEKLGLPVVGVGRNRITYRINSYVVKCPLNDYGVNDNEWEARTYRRSPHPYPLAECRMFGDILLLMEYVYPISEISANLPHWVLHVDGYQVGYTKDSTLVAFDYGLH